MSEKVGMIRRDTNDLCQATDILASISDGVFILDRDWRFIYLNKRAASIANLEPEDLLGHNLWEKYPQAMGMELGEKYRKCMAEKTPQEFVMWGALSKVWFHVRVYPFKEGILVYWRDITERKQAEEALRQSEERFHMAFQFSPVGMVLSTREGIILDVNENYTRILGATREEIIGKRGLDLDFMPYPEELDKMVRTLREQGYLDKFEMTLRKKSGELIQIATSIIYFRQQDTSYLLGMMIDITAQKRMQKELTGAKDKLEIKVQERNERLQEAYDEILESQKALKEANEQLKQYAGKITQVQEEERKRIAYELHDDTAQYLSILKMQIGALANSEEIQSPKVKEKLRYLEKDADRAFNDVRRYSHELRPTTLEHQGLVSALEQIADDFNKLGQLSAGVQIEGMEPELSEEVKLGFFRIAQEAMNNTRKHSKASRVDIDLRFNHKQICMMVRDNGDGFDTKQALKKSGSQGSLGLMSMRERAGLIGAKLRIESKPGSGTTVRVDLPLC